MAGSAAAAPPGSAVPDETYFYDQLEPYGTWYDDPEYGYVFVPADENYVPYSNGYWAYSEVGWTWVSNDPFGWATDHYGRWLWRGRWVWRPDTRWGPAWVRWRVGDGSLHADPVVVGREGWRRGLGGGGHGRSFGSSRP